MTVGVCLTVAYDGTRFHGFQTQAGMRCVESELHRAVERVCSHKVQVRGSSRTDAGVHALGQVVAFETSRVLPNRRWVQALNRYLPEDVAVKSAMACPPGYVPRYDAQDKLYRYVFHVGPIRDPLLTHRCWHLGRQIRVHFPDPNELIGARHTLDMGAMRETCEVFTGRHDFCAFRASTDTREDTWRTMRSICLIEDYLGNPELIALEIEGTAFMKNMVRIMAGTIIGVGRQRMTVDQVRSLLVSGACRTAAGDTAPPQGLTLVSVRLRQLSFGREPASD